MAATTAMCTSFKVELFEGAHNFLLSGGNTFKLALIKNSMVLPMPDAGLGAEFGH